MFSAVALLLALAAPSAAATGTWTALTHQPPKSIETCELLTDGTVLCHETSSAHWHRLSPDNQGSYVNGTWDTAATADMPNISFNTSSGGCTNCPYAPLYFASAVLGDGRMVVVGGEYLLTPTPSPPSFILVWSNLGFLYDPIKNSWSGPFTGGFPSGSVGDAMGTIIQDGRFVLQDIANTNMETLNPSTLAFTALKPTGKIDANDEENWSNLPSGKLLTIDSRTASSFEIYDPTTNAWSSGSTPVNLADTDTTTADGGSRQPTFETGPGVLRPDGTLVRFTGNLSGLNAVYDTSAGTWATTPNGNFPSGVAVQDGPACLLPNGNVLVMANGGQVAPSHFYEFALASNTLQTTSDANGAGSNAAYTARMLLLPTGEVLLTGSSMQTQTYSNGAAPEDAWRPVITSAPTQMNPGVTYSISGHLLNGFSEGAFYGDDAQSATNYPLVRITNSSTAHVIYARTHDHSRMGVEAVGSTQVVTTSLDVPSSVEPGASTLVVVVNGITSTPLSINIGPPPSVPAMPIWSEGVLCAALALIGKTLARRRHISLSCGNISDAEGRCRADPPPIAPWLGWRPFRSS